MIRGSLGGCSPETAAHTANSHRMTGLYTEQILKMCVYVSNDDAWGRLGSIHSRGRMALRGWLPGMGSHTFIEAACSVRRQRVDMVVN
jgi:hypothetical protein